MDLVKALDDSIKRQIAQVMKSDCDNRAKFELLDKLQLGVMAHHPDGLAAKVLEEIGAAQYECLYPGGGEPKNNPPL